MEELVKPEQSLPRNKEFGNIVIRYSGYDTPNDAIPLEMDDGNTYILTSILSAGGRNRVILQDLNGNTVKELMHLGSQHGYITADNENIYVFTSYSNDPKLYIYDKKNLELKYEKGLETSGIQSVCCNEKELFTFDMDTNEVQVRDKKGTVLSTIDIKKSTGVDTHSYANVYATSEGFHFASPGSLKISDEYIRECNEKYGTEFMKQNRFKYAITYDEASQTTFVASRNIIYVAGQTNIKGIMYFQDYYIKGLSIDSRTNSLVISSSNWPEKNEYFDSDLGGFLEILPLNMVLDRIKSSEAFLMKRNQLNKIKGLCHKAVDASEGDIDKLIQFLQSIKNGRNIDNESLEDKNSIKL